MIDIYSLDNLSNSKEQDLFKKNKDLLRVILNFIIVLSK